MRYSWRKSASRVELLLLNANGGDEGGHNNISMNKLGVEFIYGPWTTWTRNHGFQEVNRTTDQLRLWIVSGPNLHGILGPSQYCWNDIAYLFIYRWSHKPFRVPGCWNFEPRNFEPLLQPSSPVREKKCSVMRSLQHNWYREGWTKLQRTLPKSHWRNGTLWLVP